MAAPTRITRFFTRELPFMAAQNINELFAHEGAVAFDIDGEQWSFTFSSHEPVNRGLAPDAGLTLHFSKPAFLSFVEGTLDVVDAVANRQVTAQGQAFELLEGFGRVLRPASQSLGWEAE